MMKKYRVKVFVSGHKSIIVEARDEGHARIKASRPYRVRLGKGFDVSCHVEKIGEVEDEEM